MMGSSGADSGIDDYVDDLESMELLVDDNGFPSFQFTDNEEEEEEEDYSRGNGSKCGYEEGEGEERSSFTTEAKTRVVEIEEEGSFASEFYKCGTEWSCLLVGNEDVNGKSSDDIHIPTVSSGKNLKQIDLLQMWGLKKKEKSIHDGVQLKITDSYPLLTNNDSKKRTANLAKSTSSMPKKRNVGISNNQPRVCPFYKKISGTSFTVDAFRYGLIEGCTAYFLTHFHYDHYGGLTKSWSHGPIYCSPLTARLLQTCLSLNPLFIHPLEFGTENVIEGVKVTLLEANHCPGAALIHFVRPNGECHLHTGDFRASKQMQTYPNLVNQRVNLLYLDTTYCDPKYKFPSKEDVLSYVVRVTKDFMKKQPKTLIVVGAYSIGKECVYLAIAKALGVQFFANASRRRVLQTFGWPEISKSLCTDGKDTPLHVLPISSLKFESLKDYLKTYKNRYTAVLAFRPTGWTYSESVGTQLDLIRPSSRGNITIYGVPYSEHSSFTELKEFIQFLRPQKVIPTVNVGNPAYRDKMQSFFREWLRG